MKNSYFKKSMSIIMTVCMLLSCWVFVEPHDHDHAHAAIQEAGRVALVAPETIYLAPNAQSWQSATTSTFQYYVNNTMNGSDWFANNPTPSTTATTSGTIYFAAERAAGADADVKLSYNFLDAAGAILSGGTISTATPSYDSTKKLWSISITGGTSPSLAAATTGCFVMWIVEYTTTTGERLAASAFTGVYKPYVVPVGGAVRVVAERSGDDAYAQHLAWISGVHSIKAGSNTDGNGNSVSGYSIKAPNFLLPSSGKGMLGFLGKSNSAMMNNSTAVSGFKGVQGDMYAVFASTTAANSYFWAGQSGSSVSGNGSSDWLGGGTTFGINSFGYYTTSGNPASNHRVGLVYPSASGNITIDTSRYTNLNQIPNLGVGLLATDTDNSEKGSWYIADFSDGGEYEKTTDYFQKNESDSTRYFPDHGTLLGSQIASTSSVKDSMSGDYDSTGLKYSGSWNRETKSDGKYSIKSFLGTTVNGKTYAHSYTFIDMNATQVDKSDLRTAVYNAIREMGNLGLKAPMSGSTLYGSQYYDTTSAAWTNFWKHFRCASSALGQVDYTDATGAYGTIESIINNLNSAVAALKAGKNRIIYFDVNHDGINPNLYIPDTTPATVNSVSLSYDAATQIFTFNGTPTTDAHFGYTPFAATVGDHTFKTHHISGSKSTGGCGVYEVYTYDKNQHVSRKALNIYEQGDNINTPVTFNYTEAGTSAFSHLWCWSNSGALSFDNYKFKIKIEKGKSATEYSPVAQIATADGTYGSLPSGVTRGGYTFGGWATSADSKTAISANSAVTSDTLYAIWNPITYTITYDANGGTIGNSSLSFTAETELTFPEATRTGYTFDGWMINSTEGTLGQYNGGVVNANQNYGTGWYGNATFVAQWTINSYTVTFKDSDGTTLKTETVNHGSSATAPTVSDKAGDATNCKYSFSGWDKTFNNVTGDLTVTAQYTAVSHSYTSSVTTPATCTQDGVRTYTCSKCSDSYTEAIDATGHTAGAAATCTEPQKCTVCQAVLNAALGHLDTDKNHICDRGCGIAQGTCSDSATDGDHLCDYGCGAVLEDCSDEENDGDHKCDICGADNVTEHTKGNETKENIEEATCDKAGKYDSVYYCTECNAVMERTNDVTIAQLPHNWQNPTYTWTADGKSCTVTRVCANNAEHTESETVNTTGVQKTAPTCTEKGTTTYTATFNADWTTVQTKDVVDIPAAGHSYGEWETVTAATCTADGSAKRECSKCDAFETKVLTKLGHSFGETTAYKAATCTDAGNEAYKQCSTCSKFFADAEGQYSTQAKDSAAAFVIAAPGHNYGTLIAEVPASCTQPGTKAHYTCSVCSKNFDTDKNELDDLVIPAKGHTAGAAATCTEPQKCTVCQAVLTEALGHDYKATVTAPTCTEDGYTTHTCSRCTDSYVDTYVNELGHAWSDSYTMESDGKDGKHYQTCTRENCSVKNTAVAHTWDNGVENPEADCENSGTMTYTCTADGCTAKYTETVNPDGHTFGEWIAEEAATCTENGTLGHYECSVCHKNFDENKAELESLVITAKGHDWADATCTAPSTCTVCGATTGDALGHTAGEAVKENIVKATCEANGSYDEVVYCSVETCKAELSRENKTITKREHVYGGWYYASEADKPTYTKTGTQTRDCTNTESELYAVCSHKDTQTVNKLTDATAPTGTITYETTTWDKFLETITFGIYTAEDVVLTITAEDSESGVAKIEYFISDSALTLDEVKALTEWGTYTDGVTIAKEDTKTKVVYAKLTNTQGGTAYLSTDGFVFDTTAPVISVETDCTSATVTVTETNIAEVTVDGTAIELTDGKYTINGVGTYEVTVTDKAGTVTTETVEIKGHNYASVVTKPTCTEDGYTTYTCTACDDTYKETDTGSATGHAWSVEYSFAADGNTCTATRKCANDANHNVTIDATITSEVTTPATCEGVGTTTYTATFTENWAETQYKDVDDIPAKDHAWSVTYNFAEDGKTCTATRVCGNDATHNVTVNATITSDVTTQPTCTEKGTTTYTATFDVDWAATQTKAVVDVPAKDHAWTVTYSFADDGKTCTATRVCGNDATHNVTINATITSEVTTQPTCTEKGTTTYTAAFAENWAETQTKAVVDVPAKDHAWTVTYSFAADGKSCTATRVCANDAKHNVTVDATITSKVKTAATCEDMGTTTYTATFSEAWATEQTKDVVDIPAKDHAWTVTYSFEEDGSACTATRVCGNDASHVETATATITSAVKTPATCTEKGWTTYTATFTEDWAEEQTLDVQDIAALDHDYGEATYTWSDDNGACTATRVCSRNAEHTETATSYVTSVTVDSTCTEKGKTTYTADFSATWAEDQTKVVDIAALGHSFTEYKANDATCTVDGNEAYKYCATCELYFAADADTDSEDGLEDNTSFILKATGHDYGAWEYDEELGKHKRVCANDETHVEEEACEDSSTDNDCNCDKCGHLVAHNYGDATCELPATCTVCGATTGGVLGHDWNETEYAFAADGSACTATRTCQRDNCGTTENATATITSEITTPATCEGKGTTTIPQHSQKTGQRLRLRQLKTSQQSTTLGQ